MRVALVQLDLAWEDPAENHRRADRRLREAAACGARLAVLPEMFNTGFSMDAGRLAEPPGGPTELFLREAAEGLGLWVLAGVATLPAPGARPENHAVLVGPDGSVRRYAKIHPFSFAGEHEHYAAGTAVQTWEVEGLRITPFVCYDLRFPEVFRAVADRTDLYVVIANWPERRRAHWQALLRARAIENLAWVIGVNRCGEGGGLHYSGDSAALSPWGEVVVSAAERETVLSLAIEPGETTSARRQFPVLSDRAADRWRVVG